MPPRFIRTRNRTLWWVFALVLYVTARLIFDALQAPDQPAIAEGVYKVQRVIDGDTLLLDIGLRVRLQGIDTPETVRPEHPVEQWGAEAHQYTEEFVGSAGWEVRLTFGKERLDRYGRHLAFVWHNQRLLNEELVSNGLAKARLEYRYSGTMKRRLAAAEREARSAKRGIWSTVESSSSPVHELSPGG